MKTAEITIRERFKSLDDTRSLDAKNRLTLSGEVVRFFHKSHVNGLSVYVGHEGDILLRPMSFVPSKSLWSKKAIRSVKKGVSEIKKGKSHTVKNLEEFFEQL